MSKVVLIKENYFANLQIISNHLGSKDKIAVVYKDNAYGHGLLEMATLAKEFGITKAVVQFYEEAKVIESLFEEILILADTNIPTYSHAFHITINDLSDIDKLPKNTKVHLKVDTGMHRNGINEKDIEVAILGICRRNLVLTGVYTHHRSADKLSSDFYWQGRNFARVKKTVFTLCEKLSLAIPKFHSANSSAAFRSNNYEDDFARIGIAQYGYLESNSVFKLPKLLPVLELWAEKISTRLLKKGQRIGYSSFFEAPKDMMVSNYDIGYGDGFFRFNSNKAFKTAYGYNLLGNVSMDNISIACEDDEVCLFTDVKELARINNTISYEILTSIKPYIKKVIK